LFIECAHLATVEFL